MEAYYQITASYRATTMDAAKAARGPKLCAGRCSLRTEKTRSRI
ncbi:hypothetical protein [Senimuribacter intestinalis]|nr:hypothetical protein [Senimuribacter intestinalis]